MIEVSYISAFIAGLLTFFAPCTLPLIPGFIAYLAGNETNSRRKSLLVTAGFTLGFSTIFIAFGLGVGFLGQTLTSYKEILSIIAGVFITGFGVLLLIGDRLSFMQKHVSGFKLPILSGKSAGFKTSYVTGLLFGTGFSPCLGPILGGILTIAATSGSTFGGGLILSIYSVGFSLPFFALALFYQKFSQKLMSFSPTILNIIKNLGAVGFIIFGMLILSGNLTLLTDWLAITYESGFINIFGNWL